MKNVLYFAIMALAIIGAGELQSWTFALTILNLCIISAIMALGVNIQWGYAGIFNVGIMGFAALGGVAAVLVSQPPIPEAWSAGGSGLGLALLAFLATIAAVIVLRVKTRGMLRKLGTVAIVVGGFFLTRYFFDPAAGAIESVNAAKAGNIGGLGLPIMLSWLVGGLFAAGGAWVVGKVALGLRSDYLAIATLGIAEIIVAVLKNEDWLARGVKNVAGLKNGVVPTAYDLQQTEWFQTLAGQVNIDVITASSLFVKLIYAGMFTVVLLVILYLSERALRSPWGRMMRAIRDNRDAAAAMGKDVTRRHLQTFIIGSAVVGIAGAMLTTLEGQFTPGSYQPLRFTFLIWVMVVVGGSGNNWGSILGAFLIWFVWVEAEQIGGHVMNAVTWFMAEDSELRATLIDRAAHLRLLLMGLILLLVLRFSPRGLIPEKNSA